jgi:hypothetical protein
MKRRVVGSFILVASLVLVASAGAQAPGVKIDFRFVAAAGKTLDAGIYTVDIAPDGNVMLTPEKGGTPIEVPKVKELSKRNVQRTELVFDVVGSAKFLSEVWVPGKGGCLVGRQPDSEERQTVMGPKASK